MMMMMRASFRVLRSSSSSVGLFGSITKPRNNNNNNNVQNQNLLQKRWPNANINSDNTMEKMEILKDDVTRGKYDPNLYREYNVKVGVHKLVHALKGLVVHKKENLVFMSKNNGFSEIEEFQLELEDPHEKLAVKIAEGMQLEYLFFSTYFVEEIPFDNENCKVLLVDKITNAKDLASVLKDAIREGYPILIITTFDVHGEALDAFLASSWPLGERKIAVLTTIESWGSVGDYLDDIALHTGATVIKEEVGLTLKNVESEVLGFAAKVVVADGYTTIVSDGSRKESLNREAKKIRERVMRMTKNLEIYRWESWDESIKNIYLATQLMREIERLDQRLVRLYGGVAVTEVGTAPKKEVVEKKQRFVVALDKLKMAFRKGIVAGGGCTLDNDEHKEAVEFVKTILSYPIKQIAKKAGVNENVVVEKVLSSDDPYYGYNLAAKTSKNLMVAEGNLTETFKDFASHLIYLEDDRVKQLIDLVDELIYKHDL